MHIAIIRFSSMGDIILQTPWIAWLKRLYPKFTITFITLDIFQDFVKNHPLIDNTILIKRKKGKEDFKQLSELSRDLKSLHKVDLIMDFHGTLRAKIIMMLCYSIPSISIYKRSLLRWILVTFKWDLLKNLESHHSRIIQDFSFLFDERVELEKLHDFLNTKTVLQNIGLTNIASSFKHSEMPKLVDDASGYIIVSPVASFASKRWPMEKVRSFLEQFLLLEKYSNLKIIILGGKDDTYCSKDFTDPINKDGRIINKQGQTSLLETVEYIKFSQACVTNDTGTAHIAEALGVPVISLFGSTSESFGFRMHLSGSQNISIPLACRPCSQTGKKDCYQSTHLCMEGIQAEVVLDSLQKILVGK